MKKGVVLVIVIGVMIVIFTLALVALYLMTQESRIAEHKIRRVRAFFAAQAGLIHSLEELRKGNAVDGTQECVGSGITGYPPGGYCADISVGAVGANGTRPVSVTVDYGL